MKSKISVPIMLETLNDYGCDGFVDKLKEIGAERVFISVGTMETDETRREKLFSDLKRYIKIFKDNGFETGFWVCAFSIRAKNDFVKQVSCYGETSDGCCCPTDEKFVSFASEYIKRVAECAPDLIMLDDDFRYVYINLGCCCENHLKLLSEKIGRRITPTDIVKIFEGKDQSGDRKKWLEVMGGVMENFAVKMRAAIDGVNEKIRFGFCSNGSTWGIDGFDAVGMSKKMAGKTMPFNRFIGAPYWQVIYGFRLGYVADIERMQAAWAKNSGVESMVEGDAYPRPRYAVPACYLECIDQITRADGNFNGILKYMLDYNSDVDYETGYVDRHIKNACIYEYLEKHFSDKESKGVRIYKFPCKPQDLDLPVPFMSAHYLQTFFYPHESKIMTALSIPTSFETDGAGVCFGYNAQYLSKDALNRGLILDVVSAKILTEKGVDVGLRKINGKIEPRAEVFESGRRVKIWDTKGIYGIIPADRAKIASEYAEYNDWTGAYYEGKEKRYPAAYSYENSEGQRFFVLAFDGKECGESVYRSYDKAKQLAAATEYVGREEMLVKCFGDPDLYMMLKEDKKALYVGLWDLHADYIENATITLSREYKGIESFNGNARLDGKTVTVERIEPYGFLGIILRK